MGRQSSDLTSFGRTHCLRLPPPTEDAWNWQLRGSCLGHPLEVVFPTTKPARAFVGAKRRRSASADSVPSSPSAAITRSGLPSTTGSGER
jgi:hypothetical protein